MDGTAERRQRQAVEIERSEQVHVGRNLGIDIGLSEEIDGELSLRE